MKNLRTGTAKFDTIRAKDANGLSIQDDGGNGLFIKDGGNVGIGTTSPANKLEIIDNNTWNALNIGSSSSVGAGFTMSSNSEWSLISTSSGANVGKNKLAFHLSAAESGSGAATGYKMVLADSGNVGIGTTDPLSDFVVSSGTDATASSFEVNCGNNSVLIDAIQRDSNNTPSPIRYTAERHLFFGSTGGSGGLGNVGIGETSPKADLHITSGGGVAGTGGRIAFSSNSGQHPMASIESKLVRNDGALSADEGALAFYTRKDAEEGLAEKMRIKHDGNVGIGTTNPGAKLDVKNSSNTEVTSRFYNGGGSAPATVHIVENGSAGDHVGLFVGADDLSSAVLITKQNNVGIGTTNPANKLEIIDNNTWNALNIRGSSSVGAGFTMSSNSEWSLISTSSGANPGKNKLAFHLTAAEIGSGAATGYKMVLADSGNVGIGTTNPAYTLDVSTSVANWASRIINTRTSAGSSGLLVRNESTEGTDWAFGVYGNNSYRMIVRNDGNVGIGTRNPTAKLYVNGSTWSTTGWSSSDDRVKHNEQAIVGAIETLGKLAPKKYIKTTKMYEANHDFELDADGNPVDANGEPVEHSIEAGVIAQQVLEVPELAFMVSPEGVDEDGNVTSPHGLNYNSLFTYAIAAIQEQQSIIEDLKSQNASLESRISALES